MTEHDTHDTIRADRACIACGFNLFGQPITREAHYNLLITRCPECGQAAALQSYPTMSHWVNRFRAILSALWIALTLGILALTVLIGGVYAATGRWNYQLNAGYNDQLEQQVSALETRQAATVREHLRALVRWRADENRKNNVQVYNHI